MVSRRLVQTILGVIWFLDGVLQLKPDMFTSDFLKQVILPTAVGQPAWIGTLVHGGANFATGHIVIWNAIFAAVQIMLGLALICNIKIKTAIVLSIVWSAIVWSFGEGFGQLLTGQALVLSGAPGAALVYGVVAGAAWPTNESDKSAWHQQGIRFAQVSLAVLFLLGAVLHLQPTYLTAKGLSQAIAVSWFANAIGNQGAVVSIIFAVVEVLLALALIFKFRLRVAVGTSILLSFMFWWLGQSFGQFTDPLATDFNTGLLMIVLAVCAEPAFLQRNRQAKRVKHGVLAS